MPVSRRLRDRPLGDAVLAGGVAAVISGVPSTAWALAHRRDPLEGARAAGAILLGDRRPPLALLAAAVPVHLGLSLGWAAILVRALPPGREPLWGVGGGLAIAALDLGIVGARIDAIRRLPQLPQWADHAAYGLAVGLVVARQRRRRRRAGGEIDVDAASGPQRPLR